MTFIKFISRSILSVIMVNAVNREAASAQIKTDKITVTAAFSRNIFNNSNLNNPQLVELNRTLYSISNEVKRDRIRNSSINIGLGAAFSLVGLTFLNVSNKDDSEGLGQVYAAFLSATFLVSGAAMVTTGVYQRSRPSDVEEYYIEFQNIPEITAEESERKLIAGELRFEELAHSVKRKRHIYSGIFIALGVLAASESGDASDGVLMIGAGAWKYFSKSKLEKTYDSYITMKKIYSYTEAGNKLSWKMFPLPGKGIGGVVSLDF